MVDEVSAMGLLRSLRRAAEPHAAAVAEEHFRRAFVPGFFPPAMRSQLPASHMRGNFVSATTMRPPQTAYLINCPRKDNASPSQVAHSGIVIQFMLACILASHFSFRSFLPQCDGASRRPQRPCPVVARACMIWRIKTSRRMKGINKQILIAYQYYQ